MDNSHSHIFTSQQIKETFSLFHELTGLTISFSDLKEGGTLLFYPEKKRAEFCQIIQQNSEGKKRCYISDRKGTEKAIREGKPSIYQCHAGLVNVCIPLFVENEFFGVIITGQLLTHPPSKEKFAQIKKRLSGIKLDWHKLYEAYFKVQRIPREKLLPAIKLLSFIAQYYLEKETILRLQEKIIRQKVRYYRKIEEAKKVKEEILEQGKKLTPYPFTEQEKAISAAIKFMEKKLHSRLRLKELAKEVNLSPYYFSHLFKRITGFSPISFFLRMKMEKAKELILLRKDLSIKQIAFILGFSEPCQLSRQFRSITGYSPTFFRNKINQ